MSENFPVIVGNDLNQEEEEEGGGGGGGGGAEVQEENKEKSKFLLRGSLTPVYFKTSSA